MGVVEADQLLIMLVLDMLDNEFDRAEGLITDLTHILLSFNDLTRFVLTVLIFQLNKELVLLGVSGFLLRSSLEQFFSGLHIILLKLQS